MTCALIYRPPNYKLSLFYPSFVKLCEWFLKSDRILISGDFNFPSNQISENNVVLPLLNRFAKPNNIWETLPEVSSDELVSNFDEFLLSELNKHAPLVDS
jgi:hypothetical protein